MIWSQLLKLDFSIKLKVIEVRGKEALKDISTVSQHFINNEMIDRLQK